MPQLTTLMVFTFACFVLAITPGPAMILIISTSVSHNLKAGLVSALSSGLGLYSHAVAVAFGLSALLVAVPVAFDVIKIAGALYLIYLGIKTILSANSKLKLDESQNGKKRGLIYQGLAAAIINPKVALFFLAFLPQFVEPAQGEVTWQIMFLGAILTAVVTLVGLGIALLASYAAEFLKTNSTFVKVQNWVFGSVFMMFGAQLFLAEHK